MIDKVTTRSFYQKLLGFSLLADHGDYLILQREGVELHFFAYPTLVPAKSDFMAYIRVKSNLAMLHTEILNQGATPEQLRPIEEKPWGMKEFSVIDPNGTCLTFGEEV